MEDNKNNNESNEYNKSIRDSNTVNSTKEKLEEELKYTREAKVYTDTPQQNNNIYNAGFIVPEQYKNLFNMSTEDLERHEERLQNDIRSLEDENVDFEKFTYDIVDDTISFESNNEDVKCISLHDSDGNTITVFEGERVCYGNRLNTDEEIGLFKITEDDVSKFEDSI